MRLEIDTSVSAPPPTKGTDLRACVDSVELRSALNQGIKAAQAGNRAHARISLLRATELDHRNESAWLWLASISEYPEELLGFLNHVLEINPENQRAVEWKMATHALLSKTFVQRGMDASSESQKDFARECFQTALEYDDRNAIAWVWMASMSDFNSVKVPLLEKALEIEPDNESALTALEAALAGILKQRLGDAKAAAVSGNHAEAIDVLDALLALAPDSIEAWTLKSHLSESFDEKIRCYESVLAVDPENVAAMAGRDSLLSVFGTVGAASAESFRESGADDDERDGNGLSERTIAKSPSQASEISLSFIGDTEVTWEARFEKSSAEGYDKKLPENVAEPFASSAEETAEPDEAAIDVERVVFFEDHVLAGPAGEDVTGLETSCADLQPETVAYSSEGSSRTPGLDCSQESTGSKGSHTESESAIAPPPGAEMAAPEIPTASDGESFIEAGEILTVKAGSIECPFCRETNDPQVITCRSCLAVLTLSDLELLLANQNSDKVILRRAVEEMERERLRREFGPDELITLGTGHINLRNLHRGYSFLLEASKLSPNNVVLSGQVNSLLIRLEEIRKQEEAHLKMPKGKSILVVDDSPTVRKLIADKLQKCGHDVICANDGVEAMERLEHFVPDLILLDVTMPRMDGYQVCKNIRNNKATKDVTVVMISGKDGFFDKVRGRMAGTTGYITKPFGPDTLMKVVEMYLRGEAQELDEV